MNPLRRRALGAGTGAALLLLGALAFQYLGGLAPCHLCLLQRWPHALAIALALLILVWPRRELAAIAAVVVLTGAAIAGYHAGVEAGFWAGPATCTAAGSVTGVPTEELLAQILEAPVVRCDDIAWSLAGVSMAGWNAILSGLLALLWWRAYASSSASQ